MSDKPQQPLPFIYQFAAGAVAGVSEVRISALPDSLKESCQIRRAGWCPGKCPSLTSLPARTDPGDVRFHYPSIPYFGGAIAACKTCVYSRVIPESIEINIATG